VQRVAYIFERHEGLKRALTHAQGRGLEVNVSNNSVYQAGKRKGWLFQRHCVPDKLRGLTLDKVLFVDFVPTKGEVAFIVPLVLAQKGAVYVMGARVFPALEAKPSAPKRES
jgi:hypothetical protein